MRKCDYYLFYMKQQYPADRRLWSGYFKIQYPNGMYDLTEENDNYLKWLTKEIRRAKNDYVSEDLCFEFALYLKIQYPDKYEKKKDEDEDEED